MKYLITESRLEEIIIKYLYSIFPVDEMSWHHPEEYNPEKDQEEEDLNRVAFYIGRSLLEDAAFRWYNCEYFNPDSYAQEICPTVSIEGEYSDQLNGYFGDTWIEPFKKWFTLNFELPVKTVQWM